MNKSLTDQEFADMTGLLGFIAGVLTFAAREYKDGGVDHAGVEIVNVERIADMVIEVTLDGGESYLVTVRKAGQ